MITTKEAEHILNVSSRRIRVLCEQERIDGAIKKGGVWLLPDNPVVLKSLHHRPSKIIVN